MSIWQLVSTRREPQPTPADLGRLLAELHRQPQPPHPPDEFDDPFAGVENAAREACDAITESDRSWFTGRIADLRERWLTMRFPHPPTLIHGDAHPGNLMRTSTGAVVFGDWDHVAIGPREWDLVQIHYTHRRFGRPQGVETFTRAYGWDIRKWAELGTLIEIREITGLSPYVRRADTDGHSRTELLHRLRTLRSGDDSARWNSPSG